MAGTTSDAVNPPDPEVPIRVQQTTNLSNDTKGSHKTTTQSPPSPDYGTDILSASSSDESIISKTAGKSAKRDKSSSKSSSDDEVKKSPRMGHKKKWRIIVDTSSSDDSSNSASPKLHVSTTTKLWKLLGIPKFSTHLTLCTLLSNMFNIIQGRMAVKTGGPKPNRQKNNHRGKSRQKGNTQDSSESTNNTSVGHDNKNSDESQRVSVNGIPPGLGQAFQVSTSTKQWKLLGFPKFSTHVTSCILSPNTYNTIQDVSREYFSQTVEIIGNPEIFHSHSIVHLVF